MTESFARTEQTFSALREEIVEATDQFTYSIQLFLVLAILFLGELVNRYEIASFKIQVNEMALDLQMSKITSRFDQFIGQFRGAFLFILGLGLVIYWFGYCLSGLRDWLDRCPCKHDLIFYSIALF